MESEKVVRRGEVWWIDAGISVGGEEKMGRPGVVVSGDTWNERESTVVVVYVSLKPRHGVAIYPKVDWGEGLRRVLCNQVYTVDKSRLDRKVGELTEPEMIRVAGALAVVMQIPQYQHNAKPQPKQEEPADVVALRCERDMWQQMYEKTMEMLVELRVTAAVAQRTVRHQVIVEEPLPEGMEFPQDDPKPPTEEPKPPKKKEKPLVVKKEEPLLVDINHCSELALRELGLSDADVASVIACRPFESVPELNCVPDLDTGWVAANEHRFVCTPIVVEEPTKETVKKVNLNTCKPKDLREIGITQSLAYKITSDRKKNGPFALVGDVTRVVGVGQRWLDQWIDKLEV